MTETYQNYIDGEWRDSETGETFDVKNPADTSEVVGSFQRSSEADTNGAIDAAASAEDEWADTPAATRGEFLRETAKRMDDREEELTETLVREEGKLRGEANGEVNRAIDIFYYYAERALDYAGERKKGAADQNLYYVREPMGVAGLIVPWNYPIAIPCWKMAPALATGNTLVIKPSKEAPNVLRAVFECMDEAADEVGVPDGVFNFVSGGGEEVGQAILDHEEVDTVSFTGSRQVGEMIYDQATDDHKRVQTELGSKNPTVVSPSADVQEAAETVASGAFGVTGQACTATERAIVHDSQYEEFVEALVEEAESVEPGFGLDEDSTMGPHVSESELESTLEYVEKGKEEGATLEYGGERLEGDEYDDGYFVQPTVFTDVDNDMDIMQEEVFGPFVGVTTYSDFEEAVELVNDVEFGLSAGIVTDDHTEANRFVDEVDFGVVKVNEATTGLELHVPFGGMNASSSETYREQGEEGMDFFTIIKTVYEDY
ncbi:aldehyde dehydrogenase family protein [Halogeometricum sp. S1BR25-6]|uniref:Aldehyde dehydrogenase family protein n=1 Tax=Halogeometricum salsisoli TaxID=2950536 RepID=A0ABU2GGW8_9EURY|nr:aldehyde dehydrogenase family protein [Halogeometricum sp. S1BR25-6]MDS0300072.1 aldehyde dehydrogenase family protein [Halogeometricum sp. S1BR25-6]